MYYRLIIIFIGIIILYQLFNNCNILSSIENFDDIKPVYITSIDTRQIAPMIYDLTINQQTINFNPSVEQIKSVKQDKSVEQLIIPEQVKSVEQLIIPEQVKSVERLIIPEQVKSVERLIIPETVSPVIDLSSSSIDSDKLYDTEYSIDTLLYIIKNSNKAEYYYKTDKIIIDDNNFTGKIINTTYYTKTIINSKEIIDNIKYTDIDLPNKDIILYENKLGSNNVPVYYNNFKKYICQDSSLSLFQYTNNLYNNIDTYNIPQCFLININNKYKLDNFKNMVNTVLDSNNKPILIDNQIGVYTNIILKKNNIYQKFIIYTVPSLINKFENLYEKKYNDNINIIPLLSQLKINMNDITFKSYNSMYLINRTLFLRLGMFNSKYNNDISDIINKIITNEQKIVKEDDLYTVLILQGLHWLTIISIINLLSTYPNVFQLTLFLV